MGISAPIAAAVLVVKVFAAQPLEQVELSAVGNEAGTLLLGAGVQVEWTDCASKPVPQRCAKPPQANELLVRITAGGDGDGAHLAPIGTALIDHASSTPVLATIFADRVTAIARAAGIEVAQLLGRVAAHEIGHLLLNSTEHPERGLMRATWSIAELRRGVPADWTFSHREAAAMREAVSIRQAAATRRSRVRRCGRAGRCPRASRARRCRGSTR